MSDSYTHVYLSPHLDDAVLSCGGLIHQQVSGGQCPLAITLFAGKPRADLALSDFAQSLHERWGDPADVVAARWAEDRAALKSLGADYLRLGYLDCIYRGRDRHEEWYYASEQALFGAVHPEERGLPLELADALDEVIPPGDEVTLYAPLTVGNHVDHQLVCAAALVLKDRGWPVVFYEEYPYAEADGALLAALSARGAEDWQALVHPLSEADVAARVRAIACYQSQLEVLFEYPDLMPGRVREHVAQVGGERRWYPERSRV